MRRRVKLFLLTLVLSQSWLGAADVWHEVDKKTNGWKFYASNPTPGPRTYQIRFSLLENLKATQQLPLTVVVPGEKTVEVIGLVPLDKSKANNFKYTWDFAPGDVRTAKHDKNAMYVFPFGHGKKYQVSQGHFGAKSHNKLGANYAVDFAMAVGEPVCAARKGLVVEVKEDSKVGGDDLKFFKEANFVKILHNDGSVAMYSHLEFDSASVKPGDWVKVGQEIGSSGNTGYSSGPHLDFKVMLATEEGKVRTVPVLFRGAGREKVAVREGWFYYSRHPWKPKFREVLGRNITDETFKKHHEKLQPKENVVELRELVIDNTTVIFVRNHDPNFAKDVTFQLTERLNLASSRELPATIRVPKMSERYLLFLRAKDANATWRHKFKIDWKTAE